MKERIRRYLLGAADEEARTIEERILTDTAFSDEVDLVEAELVDEYVRGTLSDSDRRNFERSRMQTDEGVQSVRFAEALRRRTTSAKRRSGVMAAALAAAAAIAAVVGLSWLNREDEPAPVSIERSVAQTQTTDAAVTSSTPSPVPVAEPIVLAVMLTSGGTRSTATITRVDMKPGTDFVELQVPMTSEESFQATVRDADAAVVFKAAQLSPTRGILSVRTPAEVLKRGDYVLFVDQAGPSGRLDTVGTYPFRVSP